MIDARVIQAALAGEAAAVRALVDVLAPVVQARVARALMRRGGAYRDSLRHDVEDYTQEAFGELFANKGRALLGWDPEAGRSLQNYVGQRVEWFVAARLRRDEPAAALPVQPAHVASADVEHRDSVRRVITDIETRWSRYGLRLFYLIFVLQLPSKEVGAELGLSCDAVDQWRFRLREFARTVLRED
jgi:DNA-directed RNA polymerase specialized sigma24 family protein